ETEYTGIIGGITGYADSNTVIDNCQNLGSLDFKYSCYGSIVGINSGYVTDCESSSNMGKNTINIIGGIVGVNFDAGIKEKVDFSGLSSEYNYNYYCGTIEDCSKDAGTSLTGREAVGGIAGINIRTKDSYKGGIILNCKSFGEVKGQVYTGGFVGINYGEVSLESEGASSSEKRLVVTSSNFAGGIIGKNTKYGNSTASGTITSSDSLYNFGKYMTIKVKATSTYAGGLVGFLEHGSICGTESKNIKSYAEVDAVKYAGGIVGNIGSSDDAVIKYVENLGDVVSSSGYAGGIVPENKKLLQKCVNRGNVTSSGSFAGGITAVNSDEIVGCEVSANGDDNIKISSVKTIGGAIVAKNPEGGIVRGCMVGNDDQGGKVIIYGTKLSCIGYAIGENDGVVRNCTVETNVDYTTNQTSITVGGIVGKNTSKGYVNYDVDDEENYTIYDTTMESSATFTDADKLKKIKYLGGVVGENYGHIANTAFIGTIGTSSYNGTAIVGAAVGGITGLNAKESGAGEGGIITQSYISNAYIRIKGFFGANMSMSSKEKISASAYLGGIAGLNEENATIKKCYIDGSSISKLYIVNGMLGGITGANAGTITYSGYAKDMPMVDDVKKYLYTESTRDLNELKRRLGKTDSQGYSSLYNIDDGDTPANLEGKITTIKMEAGKGYAGGITGFNARTGVMKECASGKWMVFGYRLGGENANGDVNSYVAGVAALNESDKDFICNVNNAFVCRQERTSQTKLYAGGVIALQSNPTSSEWFIDSCINAGVVKEYNTHNVGGIVSHWINNGGTVQRCINFGTLYTNRQAANQGTAGGIIGFVNGLTSGQTINILSCENHGVVNIPVGSGLDVTGNIDTQ
ncbi:MAG: hypothetical protein K6G11_07265, partial [Lachnospiraceae bacterium]|nr:hypothetical protein [Lachnospiraceae bacterium]